MNKFICNAAIAQAAADAKAGRKVTAGTCGIVTEIPETDSTNNIILPECRDASLPSQWRFADRKNSCLRNKVSVDTWEYVDGVPTKVIGNFQMRSISTMTSRSDTAGWSMTSNFSVTSWWGVGYPTEMTMGAFSGDVTSADYFPVTHPSFDVWEGEGNLLYNTKVTQPGTIYSDPNPFFYFSVFSSDWTVGGPYPFELPIAVSRCDSVISGGAITIPPACVFNHVVGHLNYSTSPTTNPEFTSHVSRAQLSGLPGRLGSTTNLHRLTGTGIAANGRKACPGSLPNPPVGSDGRPEQCDEYPFRSTQEGASTSPTPGTARTFPGCAMTGTPTGVTGPTGWSRCFINATQNGRAGNILQQFYNNQRILSGDPYQIGFVS